MLFRSLSPQLMYGSVIWNNVGHETIRWLMRPFKMFWRMNTGGRPPNTVRNPVEQATYADLMFAWSIFNGKTSLNFADYFRLAQHSVNTRFVTNNRLLPPRPRRLSFTKSYTVRMTRALNSLPPDSLFKPREVFKSLAGNYSSRHYMDIALTRGL